MHLFPKSFENFFLTFCRPNVNSCVLPVQKKLMNEIFKSQEELDSIIAACLSQNASAEETAKLNEWLGLSQENQLYFRACKEAWHMSATLAAKESVYFEDQLQNINKTLDQKSFAENTEQPKSPVFISFIRYAAVIVALVGLGFLLGHITNNTPKAEVTSVASAIYAPIGSKAVSVLPDGTQVWLNAGSKLEYNNQAYNLKDRSVSLTGEAYFKVKTNPQKPFVVNVKGIFVKALGTEFNVKAYPEETQVITTLVEGVVKIEGQDKNRQKIELSMKPNQTVTLFTQSAPGTNTASTMAEIAKANESSASATHEDLIVKPSIEDNSNTQLYTSWKDNKWVLEGERIGNLTVILERKFNVHFEFSSEELKNYTFTGTFRNETLEQVLSVLKLTTPMKYEIGKGSVKLYLDPVLKSKYQKFINK